MIAALSLSILAVSTATLPIEVDGDGYLRFAREGRVVYAKEATLVVTEGKLAHESGASVLPTIEVPGNPTTLDVSLEGVLSAEYGNRTMELGRLVLALPEEDLIPDGDFLVCRSRPALGDPGTGLFGVIRNKAAKPAKPATVTSKAETTQPAPNGSNTVAKNQSYVRVAETTELPPNAKLLITIHESAVIDTEQVTVGQTATVEGDPDLVARANRVQLGSAPPLGVVRSYGPAQLKMRLRNAFLNEFSDEQIHFAGPQNCKVEIISQTVTHDQFATAAREAAKTAVGDADLQLATVDPDLKAPLGEIHLETSTPSVSREKVSVTVRLKVDGKFYRSRTVRFTNQSPIAQMRRGDNVTIKLRQSGITVETMGRIVNVNAPANVVTVETEHGAHLTATPIDTATVEVQV
ncbi:MAG: hypothetical protein ACOCX1_04845 [Fimbriimonadaceae bacterium]